MKIEFETLNEEIRKIFGLDEQANTSTIMSRLEGNGLFNTAFQYNMVRGLRNIIAHPSKEIGEKFDRQYIYDGLTAIETIRDELNDWQQRKE